MISKTSSVASLFPTTPAKPLIVTKTPVTVSPAATVAANKVNESAKVASLFTSPSKSFAVPTVPVVLTPAATIAAKKVSETSKVNSLFPTTGKNFAVAKNPPTVESSAKSASATQKLIGASAAIASSSKTGLPIDLSNVGPIPTPAEYSWGDTNNTGSSTLPSGLPGESSASSVEAPTDTSVTIGPANQDITPKTLETPTTVLPVISATIQPMSLWQRIMNFLGFGHKNVSGSAIHGESNSNESVKKAAESVVRRVRSGDQNAMALMALVRDNATIGNAQAKLTLVYMKQYIQNNPFGGVSAQMGSEYDEGIHWEIGY